MEDLYKRKPLSILVKIDLDNYTMKNKKDHVFETTLSYPKFEEILVRTNRNLHTFVIYFTMFKFTHVQV